MRTHRHLAWLGALAVAACAEINASLFGSIAVTSGGSAGGDVLSQRSNQ